MISRTVTIKDKAGLHSKTAAVFIKKASGYKSSVWIEKDERKANAKSLLGLLSLAVGPGAKITVIAEGEDEEKAAEELKDYLSSDELKEE